MSSINLMNWTCDLSQGNTYKLELLVVGSWWKVGTAKAVTLSSSDITFSGSYDRFGYKGSFDLTIKVTNNNNGELIVNGKSRPCTFSQDGKYLHITFNEGGKSVTLDVECWEKGIWLGGTGVPGGHHIWIGN